jgi:phosphotransferase system HPr-like phosphotransfer protein
LQIFQQVAVGLHVYITGKFEDLLKEWASEIEFRRHQEKSLTEFSLAYS